MDCIFKKKRTVVIFIFLVGVLIAILRLPTFFEPLWYSDEGLSLTVARRISRGGSLYKDIHDNKPPLFYWVLSIWPSLGWAKLLGLVTSLGATITLLSLYEKFFNRISAITSALFVGSLLSLPALEGNVANGELYMVFPVVLGVSFGFQAMENHRPLFYFLSGVSFAGATLFKIPSFFDFLAFGVFLFLIFLGNTLELASLLSRVIAAAKNLTVFLVGFAVPWVAVAFYCLCRGTWRDALFSIFAYNFSYVGAGKLLYPAEFKLALVVILLVLPVIVLVFLKAQDISLDLSTFALFWFCFSFFGALISGRPYTHYLIQVIPALGTMLAVLMSRRRVIVRLGSLLGLISFFALWFFLPFYRYPTASYYQNFVRYVIRDLPKRRYYQTFGPHVLRNYEAATVIKRNSSENDRLMVWGDDPALYYLTGLEPAVKYFLHYHMTAAGKKSEMFESLIKNPPGIFVLSTQVPLPEESLLDKYQAIVTFDSLKILQLRS